MGRQRLTARTRVYASVMLVTGIAMVNAAQVQPQIEPPTRHATLEGTWNLNAAAGSATGDLRPAQGSQSRGGFGGGRRGGRGGGRARGGTRNQNQKVRAFVGDLTNAPQKLTIALSSTDVTITSGTGQSETFVTNEKPETHSLPNGTFKTTTKRDGAILTQHIDAGDNLKFLRTYYISGDQLIVTITPDSGSSGSGNQPVRPGQPAEQRSVYDPAR